MKSYRCDCWSRLAGAKVEIRRHGQLVRSGVVDAVTPDNTILWLAADHSESRALFESAEGYEVWADPHDLPGDSPCQVTRIPDTKATPASNARQFRDEPHLPE